MTGNLRALPGPQVSIKLAAQFQYFSFQALKLQFAFLSGGQPSQIFDVLFQAFDFVLSFERGAQRTSGNPLIGSPAADPTDCFLEFRLYAHTLLGLQRGYRAVPGDQLKHYRSRARSARK